MSMCIAYATFENREDLIAIDRTTHAFFIFPVSKNVAMDILSPLTVGTSFDIAGTFTLKSKSN